MAGLQFSSGIDKGFEKDLQRMNKQMNSFSNNTIKQGKNIDKTFVDIKSTIIELAAVGGFATLANEMKDLTNETYKYRNELGKLTGLQGDELNTLTANVAASAQTFGKDVDEMSLAVTNFAKGMDIDFAKALELVDKGFIEGADGSKQFLDQLKEYSPLLKEAGLTAQQSISLMTEQVNQGIFSDKGIDTIKEANLRLREMPKATSDAINAIGLSADNIQKSLQDGSKSTFDIIQEISAKLGKLPANSAKVGTAIADIFGGPGEDAGLEFIKTLGKLNDEFDKTNQKISETQKQEQELLKANQELQQAFSSLLGDKNPLTEVAISAKEALTWLIENKDIVIALAGAFGVWKASVLAISAVQKINTALTLSNSAAQKTSAITGKQVTTANYLMAKSFKSLRAAFASNPIGLLVTGLTLAIPLITSFVNKTEKLSNTAKDLGEVTRTTNTNLSNQTSELRRLQAQLSATQPGSEARKKVIEDINKEYPDLLKNIDTEKVSLGELNGVFDSYINNLEKTIRLKTLQGKLESLISEQQEAQNIEDANQRYLTNQDLNERISAIREQISYQKNIVDVSQRYADLIKEQNQLLKEQEETKLLEGVEEQLQTFEEFSKSYNAARSKFEFGELVKYEGTEKELTDAYTAYVNNNQNIVSDRQKTKDRLAQIQKEIEEELKSPNVEPLKVKTDLELDAEANEKQRKELIKQNEIDYQQQINDLTKLYGDKKDKEDEFNKLLLQARLVYLNKLSDLTLDKLEKLKIEEEKINLGFELAGEGKTKLEQLELNYKKELLLLKNKTDDEIEFNKKALEAEKKYLEEKLKLTTDENDKLEIETKLKTVNTAIDESLKAEEFGQRKRIQVIKEAQEEILRLEKKLQEDITIAQAQEIQKQIAQQKGIISSAGGATDTDTSKTISNNLNSSVQLLGDTMSRATDELTASLGDLVSGIGEAINTLADSGSNNLSKITGVISLAIQGGKYLSSLRDESDRSEVEAQREITNRLSEQISMEMRINELRKERRAEEIDTNVFLDPYYIDVATNAVKNQQDAYESLNNSIGALQKNAIFTQTSSAKRRLFGSKTVESDFSINQILDDYSTPYAGEGKKDLANLLIGPEIGIYKNIQKGDIAGIAQSFLDPAGIFGGYAARKGQEKNLKILRDSFEDTLNYMGKTSADIANLSTEEWLEFFTLLDEAGKITDQATKRLLEDAQKSLEDYKQAMEDLEGVIQDVAGSLGSALGDSIINSIQTGEDALHDFAKTFDDVLIQMAKQSANQIFFRDLFDTLQEEMKQSITEGDQQWQDDLLRFYDQLPDAIGGAQDFLEDFDKQLKDLGFEGIEGSGDLARAGTSISESITEQTGTEIKGRINAIMMSNQIISENSSQMLTYAVQNLVTLNKIKENTDYLPQIAKYTKQTADKL